MRYDYGPKWCNHRSGKCIYDFNGSNFATLPVPNNHESQDFVAWSVIPLPDFETLQNVVRWLKASTASSLRDYNVHLFGSALNHFAMSSNVWRTTRQSARKLKVHDDVVVKITYRMHNGQVEVINVERTH